MVFYSGRNGGRGGDGVATGAGAAGQGGAAGMNGDGSDSNAVGGEGAFSRNFVAYFKDAWSFDLVVVYDGEYSRADTGGGGVGGLGGYRGGGGGSGGGGGGGGGAQDRYYNPNPNPYQAPPNSIAAGGGGGGGGGDGMVVSTDRTIGANDLLIGGAGGDGGDGKVSLQENRADGGGGGGGGNAALVTASLTLTTNGELIGGAGGGGGLGGGAGDGFEGGLDGQGGQGGYGVAVTANDVTIVNTGSITGGSGAAATGGGGNGGRGGYGIVAPGYGSIGVDVGGDNLTIINSGSISAGRANGGGQTETLGVAIRFGDGGRLVLSAGGVVGTITGDIELNGGVSFETGMAAGVDLTLSNAIIGSGALIKSDAGTLTLTGVNSYSGGTTLSGGVLSVSTDANLGAAPTSSQPYLTTNYLTIAGTLEIQQSGTDFVSARGVVLYGSGTIQVDGSDQTATFSGTFADGYFPGFGASSLNKTGDGTLVLTYSSNFYRGMTNIEDGTLALRGGGAIAPSAGVALATGATFDISGLNGYTTIKGLYDTADGQAGSVVLGDVDLRLNDASGSFGGVISGLGGLTIERGVQTLTGQNTYLGLTTLKGGMLVLDGAGRVGQNDIVFEQSTESMSALVIDGAADPGPGGLFSNTLVGFNDYKSDLLDLRELTYAADATAVVANGVLTVTSGGLSEQFLVRDAGLDSFEVGRDGQGGTLVGIATLSPISTVDGGAVTPLSLLAYGGKNLSYTVSTVTSANGTVALTVDNGGVSQVIDLGDGALGFSMDFSANTKSVKLSGGDYNDVLKGGLVDDTLSGGGGDDVLTAGGGRGNLLEGGEGDDLLTSGAGSNLFYGGDGQDTLTAGDGYHKLYGEDGDDILTTGGGRSYLFGGVGQDTLTGSGILSGGDGDDVLISKMGDSVLYSYIYGGRGDDTLIGGTGLDLLTGKIDYSTDIPDPDDRDTVSYENSSAGVIVDLRITAGPQISAGDASGDYLVGIDNLRGSAFNDTLRGDSKANALDGGAGNDRLIGWGGADTMTGGLGDDIFYVANAGDRVHESAGGGKDLVYTSVNFSLAAGEEIETIRVLQTTAGLELTGNEVANRIFGGVGGDTLDGGGASDTLLGGDGADSLVGGAGDDRLTGGDAADILNGGAGKDVLTGGAGADIFVFDSITESAVGVARDVIVDFSRADGDVIDLSGIDANGSAAGMPDFTFIGDGAFSKTAGELHYRVVRANVIVEGDVDGDGRADFQLVVRNATSLSANDFDGVVMI